MKLTFLIFSFLYIIAATGQPLLEPYVLKDAEQDYVRQEYMKYKVINSPELLLPQKWTIVNISYLYIIDPRLFDPFCKKNFLKGLRNDTLVGSVALHHIIDLDEKKLLIWSAFKGSKCEEIKSSLYNPGMFVEFHSLFEYIRNHYSQQMEEAKVFVIDPLDDIFIVYKSIVYVYSEEKFIEATSFLKKKYKTRIEFMKRVGYKVW